MAFQAGKPSLVIPFLKISAQLFWAGEIERINCEKQGHGAWELTAINFGKDLEAVLNGLSTFGANSQAVGEKMKKENAIEIALDLIQKNLIEYHSFLAFTYQAYARKLLATQSPRCYEKKMAVDLEQLSEL
ncbi:hypothetical protein HK098_004406 [Nowakowskiella sp. JEL0407]|nr:hypothetical protein HK098_004406 [Nowakowskiella sp. JEL0407]